MRRTLWLPFTVAVILVWLSAACTPEEVGQLNQLLTVAPTLMAPTPSATLGPSVVIDAQVRQVSTLMSIIAIYPSQEFDRVVVDEATTIVGPGGRPLGLAQIRPDDIITVSGPPIGDGHALLATRIAVRPASMLGVGGESAERAEAVISRFFQAVNVGNINHALQLISPAARARQGVDVWETRLRAIQEIRLLSIAQANQSTWTPNWQEYLVTARVTAGAGGEWETGVGQRYVDVVRGTGGPWLILDVRREPGAPVRMVRLEGTLTQVDQQQRLLTVQPQDQPPRVITLSEHTQIVTEDGWSLGLDELQLGTTLAVEGLPTGEGDMLPDRVTVFGVPGRPAMRLEPAEGALGQPVHIIGENWPPGAELKIYVTVPTASFQPRPIAGGVVDAEGRFDVTLTIPTRWPDDTPITEETLNVIVSTADFTAKARAQFRVMPGD